MVALREVFGSLDDPVVLEGRIFPQEATLEVRQGSLLELEHGLVVVTRHNGPQT